MLDVAGALGQVMDGMGSTDAAARSFGFIGRGRVEEGYAADLVVFDEHWVAAGRLRPLADMAAGGSRLHADAIGVEPVVVNGEPVAEPGDPAGARCGSVLRSGCDTDTVVVR